MLWRIAHLFPFCILRSGEEMTSRFPAGRRVCCLEVVLKFLVSPERERRSDSQGGKIRPREASERSLDLSIQVGLTNADRRFCSRAKTAGDFKTASYTRASMKGNILVVEDEVDIQEIVSYNLEKAGFTVAAAETGEEALDQIRQACPDLVVLDLMLPGIDGLEVCRLLKQDTATRDLPILMLTARVEEVDRVVGLELGADDYVVKPFSPRELVLRIQAILRRLPEGRDSAATESDRDTIRFGPLTIDRTAHRVTVERRCADVDIHRVQFAGYTGRAQGTRAVQGGNC